MDRYVELATARPEALQKRNNFMFVKDDHHQKTGNPFEDGFTLVELLVVLVILVLLASVVGPRVIGYLQASKAKTAIVQIEGLATALELFHIDVGRYPLTAEGIDALVKPTPTAIGWNGPYLSKSTVPLDPWGRSYVYLSPGKTAPFELMSYGEDGTEGGVEDNADIRR